MIGTYSTFGETRRRRRRLVYWRLVRFFSAVAAVAMVGGYGYQVGVSASQARTEKLEGDLVRFQQSNLDLRDELATTAQRSSQVEAALGELRQRYAAEVPQGEVADLVASIRKQLAAGVEPERLAFLIGAAAQAKACDGEPVTKRFMPRTPGHHGPGQLRSLRRSDHDHGRRRASPQRGGPARGVVRSGEPDSPRVSDCGRPNSQHRRCGAARPSHGRRWPRISLQHRRQRLALRRDHGAVLRDRWQCRQRLAGQRTGRRRRLANFRFRLFSSGLIGIQGQAGTDQVTVAVDVVDPADRRPVLVFVQAWGGEEGVFL